MIVWRAEAVFDDDWMSRSIVGGLEKSDEPPVEELRMSERDAFIAAICDAPDDDNIRLVFSDWLEEHGEPERAEFIRVQCSRATLDRLAPEQRALRKREAELLLRHAQQWIESDGLTEWVQDHSDKRIFRRGFVDSTGTSRPDELLNALPLLVRLTPVQRTRLSAFSPIKYPNVDTAYQNLILRGPIDPARLQNAPELRFPEPIDLKRLVTSRWYTRICEIDLFCFFDEPSLGLFAKSASHLRHLSCEGTSLVRGQAWAIVAESRWPQLESLNLWRCPLEAAGLRLIVNSPEFVKLRKLVLPSEQELGPNTIEILATSKGLPSIQDLRLTNSWGGSDGFRRLAQWPRLGQLDRLNIEGMYNERVSDHDYPDAIHQFVCSPHWGNLRELDLGIYTIRRLEHLEGFIDSTNLMTLRRLLIHTRFSYRDNREDPNPDAETKQDEAARLIARCPHLHPDLELWFSDDSLSKSGRRALQDRFGDNLFLDRFAGHRHDPPD